MAPSAPTSRRAEIDFLVGERNLDCIAGIFKAGHRTRAQIDAELLCLCDQRIDQMPVLDHVCEWLALLHLAAEGEKCRPHRIVEL